ncbi:hypothetical protein Bacsa_2414 [Phocaeicola salanitronis DSM 18170]|uniref:DUF4988 domain-containing protein n=1 Tax=Phocaeicola salanitronis (strain DSM 18170 / JCM 13657 / CCUG 60908 / BL78) TaxID=667015 RepID=F0R7D3_PHOSB|nr:hypothetical protein [Phocaeicola salanitronis]ADY36960.1 hypothetical protein Bacsa_2414 [Phocaeicola salanitronis DSM 18170]
MRKKYLSALLFGALLFASAGTFTSCKDYDDDIDGLRTELTELKNAVSELQSAVDNGDYVTNVEKSAEGLVITFKTAGPKTITLEDQVGSTVEVKDGVLYIDGVAQDFAVAPGTETQDQIIIENGMWSVLQEDGTYKSTGVPVSGVTVSGSQAEGFVFTIYDADGTKQEVELPSAASLITSIDVAKANSAKGSTFTITKAVFNKPEKWAGKAAMPEDKAVIFTSSELNVRINPVDAPATEVEYYLTNAKNENLSNVTLSATSTDIDDDGLTIGDAQGRAAYNGNGLYTLSMDMKVLTKSEGEAFEKELTEKAKAADLDAATYNINDCIAYAVNANSTARSAYNVAIGTKDAVGMLAVQIKGYKGDDDKATLGTEVATLTAAEVEVNKDQVYTIENATEDAALYDLYFEVSEKDATNYGVKTDDEARTFQITKRPDVSTAAKALTLYVHTLDVLGNVRVAKYEISLSDAVDTAAEYAPVTFPLSNLSDKNDKNDAFSIDINTMKEALGDAAWQEWFNATDLTNTTIEIFDNEDCKASTASDNGVVIDASNTGKGLAYQLLKADGKTAATDAADLASIKMNVYEKANALKANKQYYAKVTFNNVSSQEVNNIIVPVTFVAEPLSDLFEIASGFYNTELETITAYFRNVGDATTNPPTKPSTAVNLKDYFTKCVDDATVTALSKTDKVGETDKTEDELFKLGTQTGFGTKTLNFNAAYVKDGKPAGGYGEILNLKVSKDNYAGWKYNDTKDTKYSFNIRLMSPIYEGAIEVTNGEITIDGNDLVKGAKITDEMIKLIDYNTLEYSLMPVDNKAHKWETPQVYDVTFDASKAKYIKAVTPEDAVEANPVTGIEAQDGYFKVTGEPVEATASETLPIKVTDKWGLVLEADVKFNVIRH